MSEPEIGRLSPEPILAKPGSTWTQAEREIIYDWLLERYRYRQLLFCALHSLGRYATREDAEDAVGDFLLKQIVSGSVVQSFDPAKKPFWVFLTACLRQFCFGVKRQASVMSLVKSDDECHAINPEFIVDSRASIQQTLEEKENFTTLHRAIRILPGNYLGVVDLHHIQGKKIAEASMELRISKSAVKVRLFRARQMLSEFIKGRGKRK